MRHGDEGGGVNKGIGYAIAWIALNDEPDERDIATVASLISTLLVADLFGKTAHEIATRVVVYRKNELIA